MMTSSYGRVLKMRQILPSDERVTVWGSRKEVAEATEALSEYKQMIPTELTEEWKKRDPQLEDVEGFMEFLNTPILSSLSEKEARLLIQKIIDREKLRATVMFDGNIVWSFGKIIGNLKRIVKAGRLYSDGTPGEVRVGMMIFPSEVKPILSKYFYKFLHLECGSIAHYSIHGWIGHYPTVEALRQFFMKNEYGKRVYDHVGWRYADVLRIVKEMERILGIEKNVDSATC